MFMKVVTILGSRNVVYEGCDNSTIHNDVYEFVVVRIPKDVDKGTLKFLSIMMFMNVVKILGLVLPMFNVLENGQTLDRPEHCVR